MSIFRTPTYGHALLKTIYVLATLVFGLNLAAAAAPTADCCAVACCGHCAPAEARPAKGVPHNQGSGCHENNSTSCHNNSLPFEGDGSQPAATTLSAAPDIKFSALPADRNAPTLWAAPTVRATDRAGGIARSHPLYLSHGILIC